MQSPPPPRIVNDGHKVIATDFFQWRSFWDQAKLSWLDCHLGYLRLFYNGHPVPQHRWSFSEICILTRGRGPGGIEMLELYFPSGEESRNPLSVLLHRWQCNRFPSWQPGKRCWELEVYCGGNFSEECSVFFRRRVFYREDTVPCRKMWEGPRQDGDRMPLEKIQTAQERHAATAAKRNSMPAMLKDSVAPSKPKRRYVNPRQEARKIEAAREKEMEKLRKNIEKSHQK